MPLLTVVIPVFNGEAFIAEAVDSVLVQAREPLVVVVNDGSTDGTANILASYGSAITVLNTENRGAAAARNTGVRSVRTPFLAFLDADDFWHPSKTALQFSHLEQRDDLDAVFGHCLFTNMDGATALPAWIANTIMIRTTAFERIGIFDDSLVSGEFIEWFARATDAGLRWEMLPETVAYRRVHANNTTRTSGPSRNAFPAALHAVIKRRRGQQYPPG